MVVVEPIVGAISNTVLLSTLVGRWEVCTGINSNNNRENMLVLVLFMLLVGQWEMCIRMSIGDGLDIQFVDCK